MSYFMQYMRLFALSFILLGCGGGGGGSSSTASQPSTTTNTAPVATDQSVSTNMNNAINITLNATDTDGDPLTYTIVSPPQNGTLSGTAPNLIYTPNNSFLGTDTFTFRANDGTADSNTATVSITVSNNPTITLSGQITYDYVPGSAQGLDYTNIQQKPVRGTIVKLIDAANNLINATTTDASGAYQFTNIPINTQCKVRVLARMYKIGTPAWDIQIVDNTNSNALYVMEGTLASVGNTAQTRNLHAPSGWGGSSYTSTRVAAPFAILDDIYSAIQMVLTADPNAVFTPLQVNWSINNTTVSGNPVIGQIGTSYYTNGNLYILGDANGDADEYDNHVITHEWGHYYEDKFSRSDSIGGNHTGGDLLDMRVAFGEGWGNAFSAISLNDPVYFDTYVSQQQNGWSMNIESETSINPGWFSEASMQRIIYDIWDGANEPHDTVALGFGPIHQIMTGSEKSVSAFTSIFTFIKSLKDAHPAESGAIDTLVANENIATIDDIFGGLTPGSTPRTNRLSDYPYVETVGGSAQVTTHTTNGTPNKLGNRQYVKFHIATSGNHTITIQETGGGTSSDPDFFLYTLTPFGYKTSGLSAVPGNETLTVNLNAGDYLLDISDYNNVASVTFNVTIQ